MSDDIHTVENDHDSADSSGVDDFLRAVAAVPLRTPPGRQNPLMGKTLGGFVIDDELGRGGMGVVYRALDERLNRAVALKVLSPRLDHAGTSGKALMREARAAAAIQHAHVCTLYAVGEDADAAYIAMEYLGGGTLKQMLERDGPLPLDRFMKVASAIASALAAAHARGLVHRDLKPQNVLFAHDGTLKLVDFGLAIYEEDSASSGNASSLNPAGRGAGTPGYMAPEQVQGERARAASDVFSFGVLACELLHGTRPFAGKTPFEQMLAVTRDAPHLPPSALPSLDRLLVRCLAKDPRERPANGEQLERALQSISLEPLQTQSRRMPTIMVTAFMLALLSLGLVLTWMRWSVGPTMPPAPAGATPILNASAREPRSVMPSAVQSARKAELPTTNVAAGVSVQGAVNTPDQAHAMSRSRHMTGSAPQHSARPVESSAEPESLLEPAPAFSTSAPPARSPFDVRK